MTDASKVILGIHGLANKPEETTLKDWWNRALLEGLDHNCNVRGKDIAFDLIYWADWGYDSPISDDENDEPYEPLPADAKLETYEDGWLDSLRAVSSDVLAAPLDWAKEMLGIDRTADKVLEAKLPDLARYYNEPQKRDLLRNRLKERIKSCRGKRIMMIAHSMGSIIAYDVLREMGHNDPKIMIDHFITIGSPLGLPHVKLRIDEENSMVRTPSLVKRWTNFADRRDPVSLDTNLSRDFRANVDGVKVKDDLVINSYEGKSGKANPHKSYGYLRCPELSRTVRDFL